MTPEIKYSYYTHHRIYILLSPELFRSEMIENIQAIMKERNEQGKYNPKPHTQILNNLYLYLIGDNSCGWELNKGIYLFGNVGFGKTVLIEAFIRIIEKYSIRRVTRTTGRGLVDLLREKNLHWFAKRPLFVDDIVKECLESEYNKMPFVKIIELRYNYGAWLFLTSNYSRETVLKYYGRMTEDRLVSLVNFIECKGESHRK